MIRVDPSVEVNPLSVTAWRVIGVYLDAAAEAGDPASVSLLYIHVGRWGDGGFEADAAERQHRV
jgi:hypothetical protein